MISDNDEATRQTNERTNELGWIAASLQVEDVQPAPTCIGWDPVTCWTLKKRRIALVASIPSIPIPSGTRALGNSNIYAFFFTSYFTPVTIVSGRFGYVFAGLFRKK